MFVSFRENWDFYGKFDQGVKCRSDIGLMLMPHSVVKGFVECFSLIIIAECDYWWMQWLRGLRLFGGVVRGRIL